MRQMTLTQSGHVMGWTISKTIAYRTRISLKFSMLHWMHISTIYFAHFNGTVELPLCLAVTLS